MFKSLRDLFTVEKVVQENKSALTDQTQKLDVVEETVVAIKKKQLKNEIQLESMLDLIEEIQEAQQGKEEPQDEQLLSIVLMSLDNFEDIYQYVKKTEESHWKEQITSMWGKIGDQLFVKGFIRIEDIGKIANPELHEVITTTKVEGVENNTILDTIRAGYFYNGKVIRQAQVIIQKQ